jgi:hypothetical protein
MERIYLKLEIDDCRAALKLLVGKILRGTGQR